MRKADIEREMRRLANRDMKKKNITDFFTRFVPRHAAWMQELVRKYMESGMLPSLPTMIAEHYGNSKDKEIALLMTLCMDWKKNIHTQIQSVRELIGDSPYLWFRNGLYRGLSLPVNNGKHIEGNLYGSYLKISHLMNGFYECCNALDGFRSFDDVFSEESFVDTVTEICSELRIGDVEYKGQVLEVVFRSTDGIGLGLWDKVFSEEPVLRCPKNRDLVQFLKMWMPDYSCGLFSFSEAIGMLGFEREVDFFYAYYAWNELCRRKPKECGRYATNYQSWCQRATITHPWMWRELLPEIDFSDTTS